MAAGDYASLDTARDCAAMPPREPDDPMQHATTGGTVSIVLPVLPSGSPPPSHLASKWLEAASVVIADVEYTGVLDGGPAPGVKLLRRDFPLHRIRPPDPILCTINQKVGVRHQSRESITKPSRVDACVQAHRLGVTVASGGAGGALGGRPE